MCYSTGISLVKLRPTRRMQFGPDILGQLRNLGHYYKRPQFPARAAGAFWAWAAFIKVAQGAPLAEYIGPFECHIGPKFTPFVLCVTGQYLAVRSQSSGDPIEQDKWRCHHDWPIF